MWITLLTVCPLYCMDRFLVLSRKYLLQYGKFNSLTLLMMPEQLQSQRTKLGFFFFNLYVCLFKIKTKSHT